ncbi:hypothetical protein N7519_001529 [Penicillium mononematosum]|uniref:uncharacterized protein n=1 Tax=Penicillium mononematosum TaxID=268346 RepID=UPI002548E0F8|nr:uncharacterized protein N7519_001529 [Penicillium mononematosum]KAJ6191508.1 hypothetical protein N7519_001529 [Penicillium mononematosum]
MSLQMAISKARAALSVAHRLFNLTRGLFLSSQDFHILNKDIKTLAEIPQQPWVGTLAGCNKFVSNNPGSALDQPSFANDGSASTNPPGST